MVTGATDNGSCKDVRIDVVVRCWPETSLCYGGRADLRKTARGASSPAKPALHIPELGARQYFVHLDDISPPLAIPSSLSKDKEPADPGHSSVWTMRRDNCAGLTHCR